MPLWQSILFFWVIRVCVWSFTSLLGEPKMTCLCLFCMWQCVCWKRGKWEGQTEEQSVSLRGLVCLVGASLGCCPGASVAWRRGHGSVQTDGVGPCQSPCLLVELIAEARASLSALCSLLNLPHKREAHVMLWIFQTVFFSPGGCFRWRGEEWNNVSWFCLPSRGDLSVALWP